MMFTDGNLAGLERYLNEMDRIDILQEMVYEHCRQYRLEAIEAIEDYVQELQVISEDLGIEYDLDRLLEDLELG